MLTTISLMMLWIVVAILFSSTREKTEALRIEVERLTDEVDELRKQIRVRESSLTSPGND